MTLNPETTKFDKLRMAIGTLLAVAGVVALTFAAIMSFTSLPLTFAGILFVLSGLFIAGSHRFAELISGLLR
ncbi:MAG TPA: hypothetical protein VM581_02020 [Magnetospirillaceae bacterium]|nr:hypothetical protein [Magnetospirillaceae bacterium]